MIYSTHLSDESISVNRLEFIILGEGNYI